MPKVKFTPPTFGTAQPGRPNASEQATADVQRPRALVNALAVPIDQIVPDPDQPRQHLDDTHLDELAASLRVYGVLQPLLVREDGRLPDGRDRYRIIAGGRRYAAALRAGLDRLPVVVKDTEGALLRLTQLVENIQRQDLAPMDEARAFKELMDAGNIKTVSDLATRLHLSDQTVSDRLLLLSDQPIGDAVERGQIGTAVARDILRAADEPQAALRARVAAGEQLTKATVKEARVQATAAGITNERAKGGGRGKRHTPSVAAPTTVAPTGQDHNGYDPATPATRPDEGIKGTLQGVDRAALARVLAYGAGHGLTCAQLLALIDAAEE